MKKTWEGIRNVIGCRKKSCKTINALRANRFSPLVTAPTKIANILNSHFASCGHRLAAKLPHSEKHFSDYFFNNPFRLSNSFVFYPDESSEVNR